MAIFQRMEETFISAYEVILFCKVRRIRYTNYEQARLYMIYFISKMIRLVKCFCTSNTWCHAFREKVQKGQDVF